MESVIVAIFFASLSIRIVSIFISAANEKKIKQIGAVEYGKRNSQLLIIVHFIYYFFCVFEGSSRGAFFSDVISWIGVSLYALAMVVLIYVMYSIRHIWTVKLIIAPKEHHTIVHSPLFKRFKHPNYYLNIIPELIGIALFFHAWITLVIGMIIYMIPLVTRIRQEEAIMKEKFADY